MKQESVEGRLEAARRALAQGGMVVLAPGADGPGTGNLLTAARYATPESVATMARHGGGLVRLALPMRRCLELPLGCLEVEAGLLDGSARGADLTGRLVSRVALGPVPVVVSGVSEERVARNLRRCPSLFARGPWFGRPAAFAA